jgi:sulfide dehydrogenase cytochrome subunit
MKLSRTSIVLAAVFGVATIPITSSADELSRGAMLSVSCAGCHGTDGNSPGAIPAIAGKKADFIEQSLKDFRDGKRESTVMGRHAKGYSDEEIKLIAEYFGSK